MMNSPMEQRPSPKKEALDRIAEYDARFNNAIEEGLAEADRGDLPDHEEVVERIERILHA